MSAEALVRGGATLSGLLRLVRYGGYMIGRAAEWFNNRRWFIRYLLYAEWVVLVTSWR